MRELLIVFFVLILIVMAMAFPFKTRLMAHFNFLNTKGFYSFKVMRIKLLTGRVFLDDDEGFLIENSSNLFNQKMNKLFLRELIKQLGKRMDIKKVEMFFTGGFVQDSYSSAILCGMVSSVIKSIYSYISEKYEDARLYEDVDVTFYDNNLNFTFDIVISISLFSILKSILKANKLKNKKEIKNER